MVFREKNKQYTKFKLQWYQETGEVGGGRGEAAERYFNCQ